MKIQAMICDDEAAFCKETHEYLQKYCDEHGLQLFCDVFSSPEEAMRSKKEYNIAFLDVEMGEISGLDIAEKLRERNRRVIIFFITAYEKYIDDALNLFALRFLSKPLEYTRFYSGLDRAVELIRANTSEVYIHADNGAKRRINTSDIIYIESIVRRIKVVTEEGVFYISNNSIDDWMKQLIYGSFYRIHKSFIVNMDAIDEYSRDYVIMTNGDRISVSRKYQSVFRKTLSNYLREKK